MGARAGGGEGGRQGGGGGHQGLTHVGGVRNVNRGLLRNFRERGGGVYRVEFIDGIKLVVLQGKNMSSGANESRKKRGERAVEQYK